MAKTILVDGYNVIYSRVKDPKDLEKEREFLRHKARVFAPARVILVFDGPADVRLPSEDGVVFTHGETADEYIKEFVRNAEKPEEIIVVTRDRSVRDSVRAHGAQVMDPREFLAGPKALRQRRERALQNLLEKGVLSPKEVQEINRELLEIWGLQKKP